MTYLNSHDEKNINWEYLEQNSK